MNQEEFNQFYDKLRQYAYTCKKGREFHDISLKEDAIQTAMDRVVNWLVKNPDKYPVGYCRTIIRNSLINSNSRRKIEPVNFQGTIFYGVWGFRGRKFKE